MPLNLPSPEDDEILQALLEARDRGVLPTTLSSRELRELAADVRRSSVFAARVANAEWLTTLKELIDQIAGGDLDEAGARAALRQLLDAVGYTPEGGFPDTPAGQVPPAIAGSIEDLSSRRRLELIVGTQVELVRGRAQQIQGQAAERIAAAPAWELVRVFPRMAPRNWKAGDGGTAARRAGGGQDFRSRWEIAGGTLYEGRMIAFKGDPIWGELGSSANFDDALDTDHPPFAFRSGMRWEEVTLGEVLDLGVRGPNGEDVREWFATQPRTLGGRLPKPEISETGIDPDLADDVLRELGGERGTNKRGSSVLRAPDFEDEEMGLDGLPDDGEDDDAILQRELQRARRAYEAQ